MRVREGDYCCPHTPSTPHTQQQPLLGPQNTTKTLSSTPRSCWARNPGRIRPLRQPQIPCPTFSGGVKEKKQTKNNNSCCQRKKERTFASLIASLSLSRALWK